MYLLPSLLLLLWLYPVFPYDVPFLIDSMKTNSGGGIFQMVALHRQEGRKAGEDGYDEVTKKLDSLQQATRETR